MGLRLSSICPRVREAHGRAEVDVMDLPWDLVAERIEEQTSAQVVFRDGEVSLACERPSSSLPSFSCPSCGGTSGYGQGRRVPAARRHGTLYFLGLQSLGPDGEVTIDVPLPDFPGRFRVEALVIGSDGGGDRAHGIVQTRRAIETWVDLAPRLQVGDEANAIVRVHAPTLSSPTVQLAVQTPDGLSLSSCPSEIRLDSTGWGHVDIQATATEVGTHAFSVQVTQGVHRNSISLPVRVEP